VGVIVATAIFIAGVLAAALSQQLSDEFKAWTPWLVAQFIRKAVARLPDVHRKRLNEEWQSHVDETPDHFGKLLVAFGFLGKLRRLTHRHPSEPLIANPRKYPVHRGSVRSATTFIPRARSRN
jgi:hypothetical protein